MATSDRTSMARRERDRRLLEDLMFLSGNERRFTQDSPVLPDVWIKYFEDPAEPQRLLLTPDREATPGEVAVAVRERLREPWAAIGRRHEASHEVVYNASTVSLRVRFDELVRVVLPLTKWWWEHVQRPGSVQRPDLGFDLAELGDEASREALAVALTDPERRPAGAAKVREGVELSTGLIWVTRVVGTIAMRFLAPKSQVVVPETLPQWRRAVGSLARLLAGVEVESGRRATPEPRIWTVSLDREARASVDRSVLAIKADAARQLFGARADRLAWAVIDSGIDARHPAFRRVVDGRPADDVMETRVQATYDFSRLRPLLDPERLTEEALKVVGKERWKEVRERVGDLKKHLEKGRALEWSLLAPLLEVPHGNEPGRYRAPKNDHGTHVAGILGGCWHEPPAPPVAAGPGAPGAGNGRPAGPASVRLQGVCPDLKLYDLRVLDDRGQGDEFTVIAALQFVRHLNGQRDSIVVHGANLSLSIRHDVANYACGRTPVCEECDRLTASGVVVVAAAGNLGYERVQTAEGLREGYHSVSITDPGNAESVITVGATHRYKPHTYGVSYFSSRGPTGDGRVKPDLVAPGEKITSPLPNDGEGAKDGTSMAAPHVSGAAALLMARHNELVGQPAKIKQILKDTATDLGRERYFQGEGMLDVLRALQSV